jgi:hypothetical protein
MKIMAFAQGAQPLSAEIKQRIMPHEVPHTLKMYLEGKIEQFWFINDPDKPGVFFLLSYESLELAKRDVNAMPLASAKILNFTFFPVGPLMPLGFLLPGK